MTNAELLKVVDNKISHYLKLCVTNAAQSDKYFLYRRLKKEFKTIEKILQEIHELEK